MTDRDPIMKSKRDLWGNPIVSTEEYFVFHDESIPNKRWLLIGLVFVSASDLQKVRDILQQARDAESYSGEIHFSALPKKFEGEFGAKARVSRQWMRAFQSELADLAHFSCLAVDRHSPAYDHGRFSEDFHAYNRFTAMALKAGIAWHLGPLGLDELRIHFISDAKNRQSRPDKGFSDNFEEYLPFRAEVDAFLSQYKSKSYPRVRLTVELRDSKEEDLLQLCDVLLGAVQCALVAGSKQPTKRELGQMVVRWYQDLRLPPWKQIYQLHRKFNLWAFPNGERKPYDKVPLALLDDRQGSLF